MNILLSATIGILVFVGVLQLTQRDTLRIVVGLYILWNAANILIIAITRVKGNRAPVVDEGSGPMTDPLVQAMVLTAIVITFGFTAFLVALNFWLARRGETMDILDFKEGQQ